MTREIALAAPVASMMYSALQEPQGMEAASSSVKTGIFCPLMIRPNPLMPIEIAVLQLPPIRHINEVAISDSFVI